MGLLRNVKLLCNIIGQPHLCFMSSMLWIVNMLRSKITLQTHLCSTLNLLIHVMIHNTFDEMKFSNFHRDHAAPDEHPSPPCLTVGLRFFLCISVIFFLFKIQTIFQLSDAKMLNLLSSGNIICSQNRVPINVFFAN